MNYTKGSQYGSVHVMPGLTGVNTASGILPSYYDSAPKIIISAPATVKVLPAPSIRVNQPTTDKDTPFLFEAPEDEDQPPEDNVAS